MPKVGHVHNDVYSKSGGRLYNLGGRRGINFVNFFPNGVAYTHLVLVAFGFLVWTLPWAASGVISPRDFGGMGLAFLLAGPALLVFIAVKKLDNEMSVAEMLDIRVTYYLRQSRNYAGNRTYTPRQNVRITASVFMPEPLDPDHKETR